MSSAARDIGRELQVFLANSRSNSINASQWEQFSKKVLQHLNVSGHILITACRLLRESRSSVSESKWSTFRSAILQEIGEARLDLLEPISEILYPTSKDAGGSNSSKRKTSGEQSDGMTRKKTRSEISHQSLSQPSRTATRHEYGFQLLKGTTGSPYSYDLSLQDIVSSGAELSIIGNYQFDVNWMWETAPGLQTSKKVYLIHGEKEEEEVEWRSFLRTTGAEKRVRFIRPVTPAYGTVHSKFFVLFFPTTCRICIHTANMIQRDWDLKTQGAYMRDFPIKQKGSTKSDNRTDTNDFKGDLLMYLSKCMNESAYEEIAEFLHRYDFSSAGVSLVTSIPGIHKDDRKEDFGHPRLRKLLSNETIPDNTPSAVVCQFSSLGSIQEKWIDEEFSNTLFASNSDAVNRRNHEIQLVYPTVAQVLQSKEGIIGGTSLPVPDGNMSRDHILNKLHKWEATFSERGNEIPHIKTFVRYSKTKPEEPFWVFLGSFNLSVAAWGRMHGQTKRNPTWNRVRILSYEMGVLFSPKRYLRPQHHLSETIPYSRRILNREDELDEENDSTILLLEKPGLPQSSGRRLNSLNETIEVRIPLPYCLPPNRYKSNDTAWTTKLLFM